MALPLRLLSRRSFVLGVSLLSMGGGLTACASSSRLGEKANAQATDVYFQIADNYRRLHTFTAAGKIIIETPEVQYAGAVQVAARLPDSLIVKVEGAFGVDVGFFFVDQQRFASYAPLENTYYSGSTRDTPALIFFHIETDFEEIMSAVIGAEVPPFDSTFTMRVDGDDYRFDGRRGDYHLTYWVDAEKLVVKRGVLMNAKHAVVAKQEFSRFRKKRGVWLPQLIRAESRPGGVHQRLTIFYEHVNAGEVIKPAAFTFKVPASAKRVELSASTPEDSSSQR
jgi:hypothetical protein